MHNAKRFNLKRRQRRAKIICRFMSNILEIANIVIIV